MWTTKTENDSMNIRLLSSHSVRVWSTTWMNSIWRWWGIRTHKHIIFFVQYKTAMAPSIWYTYWQPMQTRSNLQCLYINIWVEIFSCQISQSFYATWRREGKNKRAGEKAGLEAEGKDVSVFALLWFFVRPVRRPRFGAGLLSWFLGRPRARPPGSFGCAWWWGRSSGKKKQYFCYTFVFQPTLSHFR